MSDFERYSNHEGTNFYLKEHLEALEKIQVRLNGMSLWNYLAPILLLLVGILVGYLLSTYLLKGKFNLCPGKRVPQSNADGSVINTVTSSFKNASENLPGKNFRPASQVQSVPQPLLPNNLVFPYPQSPPARSVYGSEYGMPITAEVSRTIGYAGISREQYGNISRCSNVSRASRGGAGSVREVMERKMEQMEQRHQSEMEMLKRKRNTKKEASVAVKDEIEYLDEKNPFYDSDDNSLPR